VKVFEEEYAHPTQASRVRLKVFKQDEGGGWLVTEEWAGTTTVVKTLGLYDTREAALARALERSEQLARQRFAPARSA
jgi:hypothetical protein